MATQIQIDTTGAVKSLKQVRSEIDNINGSIKATEKEITDMNDELEDIQKTLQRGGLGANQVQELNNRMQQLNTSIASSQNNITSLNQDLTQLNRTLDPTSEEFARAAIASLEAATSQREIAQASRDLNTALLNLPEGSAIMGDLRDAINDADGRMGDLQDTTRTLGGSSMERLTNSTALLREGFQNMDLDKIKIAFKGLGAAMSAIPIFLLIEGIKYLWENWDTLSKSLTKSGRELATVERITKTAIDTLTAQSNALQREINLAEAQGKSDKEIIELKKQKILLDIETIKQSIKNNNAKLADIQANDSLYESYLSVAASIARFLGNTKEAEQYEIAIAINKKERAAEFLETQKKLNTDLLDAKNSYDVLIAGFEKKSNDEEKKVSEEHNKHLAEIREKWIQSWLDAEEKAYIESIKKKEAYQDEQLKLLKQQGEEASKEMSDTSDIINDNFLNAFDKMRKNSVSNMDILTTSLNGAANNTNNAYLKAFAGFANGIQSAQKEYKIALENAVTDTQKLEAQINYISSQINAAIQSAGQIAEEINRMQADKAKARYDKELKDLTLSQDAQTKALKEQLDAKLITQAQYEAGLNKIKSEGEQKSYQIRKAAWEREKKAKMNQIIIDTIMGTSAAFMSAMSLPYPYNLIAGGISAGVANAFGVIQYENLKKSKFEEAAPISGGSTPSFSGMGGSIDTNAGQSTLFNESLINNGTNNGPNGDAKTMSQGSAVKVYVTETDISSTQNKVKVIENQAKF